MMNHRILNQIEPQDIDTFIQECEENAKKLGVSVEYYVEEYVIIEDE